MAAGASLILLTLGAGLGFAATSPWPGLGLAAKTFTVTTAIWLLLTQWISAALGGYVAGRLRTRWIGTHSHEIFFRDTAHGLVTWAVATVAMALLLSSLAVSAGRMATAAAAIAPAAIQYDVDRLFRSVDPARGVQDSTSPTAASESRREAGPILAKAGATATMSDADRDYLSTLIVVTTGATTSEALRRVDEYLAGAKDAAARSRTAAEAATRSAAQASVYTALALLVGAFIASVAAAVGGRLRDEHP